MRQRCQATLTHRHGVSRCERDAFHADDLGPPVNPLAHVGRCEGCEEDDGYDTAPLSWTEFRERW